MIEIAFDENDNNVFLGCERPVVDICNETRSSFADYRLFADEIIKKYKDEQIILVRNKSNSFSSNLFAVALFVSSCLNKTKTECVVFKVENHKKEFQTYKPYVALTIALKYAIRLCNLPITEAYKEISNMSYLGIEIKKDYKSNILNMKLNAENQVSQNICKTFEQTIIEVSSLKAYSLLELKDAFEITIYLNNKQENTNIDTIINQIVQNVLRFVDRS